jgi:hypothetical protein
VCAARDQAGTPDSRGADAVHGYSSACAIIRTAVMDNKVGFSPCATLNAIVDGWVIARPGPAVLTARRAPDAVTRRAF